MRETIITELWYGDEIATDEEEENSVTIDGISGVDRRSDNLMHKEEGTRKQA